MGEGQPPLLAEVTSDTERYNKRIRLDKKKKLTAEELGRRLRDYFRELVRQKFGTVYYGPEADLPYTLYYNRVLALLLNVEGVENFASLTVNGGTADVTIQAGEIPVLGEVSVT